MASNPSKDSKPIHGVLGKPSSSTSSISNERERRDSTPPNPPAVVDEVRTGTSPSLPISPETVPGSVNLTAPVDLLVWKRQTDITPNSEPPVPPTPESHLIDRGS
ncbi:hypothetical protein LOK49_LG09G02652 [Camellia lanceoleosa]|uniref:Uncharacterized protein n=1 Tax=Camellia lanceoleosa TaxID=1840588 RepID=A0ACC0GMZ4_9ERIC|nr:hypothetical protein LOK49_LG09G02652 [Camellia lanceoleosa]